MPKAPWSLKVLGLVPRRKLSRWVGIGVHAERPAFFSRSLKHLLIRSLKIPTAEAEFPVAHYASFGSFFARRLRQGSRPLGDSPFVSPCDGKLEQVGTIENDQLLQCKGRHYSLSELLGDHELAYQYDGGVYLTIYLAPHNYHRVHWPCEGILESTRYLSGDLWPVNRISVEHIDRLFCINERYHTTLTLNELKMTLVMVGATNVGSMDLTHLPKETQFLLERQGAGWVKHRGEKIEKGQEFGTFNMGSTVICLLNSNAKATFFPHDPQLGPLRFGQNLTP